MLWDFIFKEHMGKHMSFLVLIPFITCLSFAALYPLWIWNDRGRAICASFYQFHMGFAAVLLSLSIMLAWFSGLYPLKGLLIWLVVLLLATSLIWGRDRVSPWVVSFPSLLGVYHLWQVQSLLFSATLSQHFLLLLGDMLFVGATYAGVLGHWYLNVSGLPLKYLRNSTLFYTILIGVKAVWNMILMFKQTVVYRGDVLAVFDFMQSFEGALLGLAFGFSFLFALALSLMTLHIIKLKNTQAATGLLYVVVAALIMGDFFFKYYALSYRLIF